MQDDWLSAISSAENRVKLEPDDDDGDGLTFVLLSSSLSLVVAQK